MMPSVPSLCAERQWEQAIFGLACLFDRLQHAACVRLKCEVRAIDPADGVQPLQADDYNAGAGVIDGARNQAGVAALWNDAEPQLAAQTHQRLHLRHRRGAQHGQRAASIVAGPIAEILRHSSSVGGETARPHCVFEDAEDLR